MIVSFGKKSFHCLSSSGVTARMPPSGLSDFSLLFFRGLGRLGGVGVCVCVCVCSRSCVSIL